MIFLKLRKKKPKLRNKITSGERISEEEIKTIRGDILSRIKKRMMRVVDKIKKLSDENEDYILDFEEKEKKVDILTNRKIFVCKKCNCIFRIDKYSKGECVCGNVIQKRESLYKFIYGNHVNCDFPLKPAQLQ